MGLYKSDDGGSRWHLLDTPMSGSMVWSMAIDPVESNVMFAGTGTPSRPGIFRSADGGKTWSGCPRDRAGLPTTWASRGPRGSRWTPRPPARVGRARGRRCAAQPGRRRDLDRGERAVPNQDVPNVLVVAGPPKAVFTVNDDVWRSTDDGEDLARGARPRGVPGTTPAHRGQAERPRTVFDDARRLDAGPDGTVMRSKDAGAHCGRAWGSSSANSAMWTVSIPASRPTRSSPASDTATSIAATTAAIRGASCGASSDEVSESSVVPRES